MEALASLGPSVRVGGCIGGALLFGHLLLRVAPSLSDYLFLIPGSTITRPHQLLFAGFLDDSVFNVLLAVPLLLYSGKRLQSAWGERELLRYVLLVNLLMACASWVAMIALYILFRSEHFLFVRHRVEGVGVRVISRSTFSSAQSISSS